MQVNYQFNDEDRSELEIFQQARQMYLALTEIEDYLRTKTRYNETDTEEVIETYSKVRERVHEIILENKIDLHL
jgi:DNA-binding transcriptional MerR regulator